MGCGWTFVPMLVLCYRCTWFLLYTADLSLLIERPGLHSHLYTEDTQIYGSCKPDASLKLRSTISNCVDDVANWMRSNRLQLNTAKTEILWSTSGQHVHQLPQLPLRVGTDEVMPVTVVRSLGIHIDADVSMRSHVTKAVSGCFAVLRQLCSIRRSVPRSILQSLVTSLVLSRLDYGNAVLASILSYLVTWLQSVMNAAARLVISSWLSSCTNGTWNNSVIPCWRTLPAGGSRSPTMSALCFVAITHRPPNSSVHHWWSSFPGRRLPCLEQSATACYLCTLTACLLQPLQDSLLSALFPVTFSSPV